MEDYTQHLKLVNNCNQDDPLLSATPLGACLDQIPLDFANINDLINLTQALNLEQLIPTDRGLARDYRGLAELMGFNSVDIDNRFRRSANPCKSLIETYINKNSNSGGKPVMLNDLIKMVEKLERFDVIDDTMPFLVKSTSNKKVTSLQVGLNNSHLQETRKFAQNQISAQVENFDRLTIDDTTQSATIYDAFICYAPEDNSYAQELTCILEDHNITVTTADYLLPGLHFENDCIVRLIDMRCRKVLIILTPNFIQSKECDFRTKFANEIAIKSGNPKVIPVLYEYCDDSKLPPMIRILSKIDLTNQASRLWQIKKLVRSLAPDMDCMLNLRSPSNCIVDLQPGSSSMRNYPSEIATPDRSIRNETPTKDIEPIVDLYQSEDSSLLTNEFQSSASSRTNLIFKRRT